VTIFWVYSMLEKSLKMLEFGIKKTSRPLKVLENR